MSTFGFQYRDCCIVPFYCLCLWISCTVPDGIGAGNPVFFVLNEDFCPKILPVLKKSYLCGNNSHHAS